MSRDDRIRVQITAEEIDPGEIEALSAVSDGGLVTFRGIVRDSSEGKAVEGLDYEAYSEMAEEELRRIASEACERWPIGRVLVVHRVGSLRVGEVSVIVAVSAPHRGEAFDACEFIIDTLKRTVPIWKKERFADGSSSWVGHP